MNNNETTAETMQQTGTPQQESQTVRKPRRPAQKKTAGTKNTTVKTARKTRTAKKQTPQEETPKEEMPVTTDTVTEKQEPETKTVPTETETSDATDRAEAATEDTGKNMAEGREEKARQEKREQKVPSLPSIMINDIVELTQAPMRSIVLTDQQIQQLTMEEIEKRLHFLEETLARVLDYDVVVSDTNIWLELLVGHTSSHSDPRYNARLQFERQLEFISRLTYHRRGRFIMMGETYEEIDRFATMQDPANPREADFTDNMVCLNTAARLAKRLILTQQRENRLRIDGIGAESHHASFADPAIIRKVVELFANGKKVLLLTNDTSVAIRAMGICDDLQQHNNIDDNVWDDQYAPLRPMVFTFDDLKLLDFYTRQYHYIQMAAGSGWMTGTEKALHRNRPERLTLWDDAFRPGDRHRGDNLFTEQEKQKQKQQQPQQKQQQKQQKPKQQPQQKTEPATSNQPAQQKNRQEGQTATESQPQQQEKPASEDSVKVEKKDENKNKPRTRRKSSRARKTNTETTAQTTENTENA